MQLWVCLDEMVMRSDLSPKSAIVQFDMEFGSHAHAHVRAYYSTYLDWTITLAHDLELDAPAPRVQLDARMLRGNDGAGHLLGHEIARIGVWEGLAVRNG